MSESISIEAPSSFQPIIQRAKNLREGEMSLFVTPADLGDSPSREVIKLLRQRMKLLGFVLVSTRGSTTYEFYRGGWFRYYRDMIRYILELDSRIGI